MDCAIRTDDGMVSRHHARLYWAGGQYVVEDLGSANGVFYQEQRVARHALKHGDAVRCGSLWLRFVDTQPAYPSPQAAYAGGMPVQSGVRANDPAAAFAAQLVNQNAGPQAGQPISQPIPQLNQPVQSGLRGNDPAAAFAAQLVNQNAGPQAGQPISQPMPPYNQPVQSGLRGNDPAAAAFAAQLVNQNAGQGGHVAHPHLVPNAGQGLRTPSAVTPQPAPVPVGGADPEEVKRLNRRVEQLQTELRLYRGGKGAEVARRLEELENENSKLEQDISRLKGRIKELESTIASEGGDVRVQRADKIAVKTAEAVQQLNDILSNLRINVMAAEGEFEQFSHQIPRASFELIREALRSSAGDVDTARELLRQLREAAD